MLEISCFVTKCTLFPLTERPLLTPSLRGPKMSDGDDSSKDGQKASPAVGAPAGGSALESSPDGKL